MSEPGVVALIVDDDPSVLRLTAAAFTRLGAIVHTARCAASALTLLDQQPAIRLVFSDVHMQNENGVVLARHIRQSHPQISVVLTSGEDIADAPQGVAVLPKPWRLADLREVLAKVAA